MYGLTVAFAVAALVCAALAVVAWTRRAATPAAAALAATMAGLAVWSGADVFSTVEVSRTAQTQAMRASFIGIYLSVIGLFVLCRVVVDARHRWALPIVVWLISGPVIGLAAVCTDAGHHWFFSAWAYSGDPPHLHVQGGPGLWLHLAWCYLLLAAAMVHLVRAWRHAPAIFRAQLTSLLIGAGVPILGNVVSLGWPNLVGGPDLTPLLFVVTALFAVRAVFGQGLLHVVPIARATVFDTMSDTVFVIDAGGRLVDLNRAARSLAVLLHPDLPGELIGLPAEDVLGRDILRDALDGQPASHTELLPGLYVDARSTQMRDRHGRVLGRIVVTRDITESVRTTARLEDQLREIDGLRARLQDQSLRDPLTGLYNRRHLDRALDLALAQADRDGATVSLLIIDIDHFKKVNDEHGHQTGDHVLTRIARVMLTAVRAEDSVTRYGGEEFVIVLPDTNHAEALGRAEQLRRTCAEFAVRIDPGPADPRRTRASTALLAPARTVSATVSIGVATYPTDATNAAALIRAADRALYHAKATGRNRVTAAPA